MARKKSSIDDEIEAAIVDRSKELKPDNVVKKFRETGPYSARDNTHHVPLDVDKDGWFETIVPLGDLHLGSKLTNEKGIAQFLNIAQNEGVTKFFQAGDVHDGVWIYPEQIQHLKVVGAREQIDYAAEFIDRHLWKGNKMYAINGNHDLGSKQGIYAKFGIDMVKELAGVLPSKVQYLGKPDGGYMYARVQVGLGVSFDLVHARRYVGARSAPEYMLMKMVDGYRTTDQPTFLFVNHTHKTGYSDYRQSHSFLCSAFEFPNNWTARDGEGARHGSYILKFQVQKRGVINRLKKEFVEVHPGL